MSGWIGVDLDGTLAEYLGYIPDQTGIGRPLHPMVDRVKQWLAEGYDVRIMTARAAPPFLYGDTEDKVLGEIQEWCLKDIGRVLPITYKKDYAMIELWDDRAVRVKSNEGVPCCDHHETKASY